MDPNEIPIPPEFVPPPSRPPVVTTGSASTAPPQQPSMLDRLRQQVMQDVMPNEGLEMQRRVRAFVAGMGDTRGQSLGTALAAGMGGIEQQRAAEQQARRQTLQQESTADYQRAQQRLAEAKQLYDQDPTNPMNRLRLAQAQQALNSMRPQYQVVGTNAQGDAVVADMRDPSRTRTLEGVRPTRSEVADITAQGRNRALAERAADSDVRNLQAQMNAGDVRRNQLPPGGLEQYREERIQHHMRRLGAGAGAGTPEPEAGPRQGPSQRFQYQPPQ